MSCSVTPLRVLLYILFAPAAVHAALRAAAVRAAAVRLAVRQLYPPVCFTACAAAASAPAPLLLRLLLLLLLVLLTYYYPACWLSICWEHCFVPQCALPRGLEGR